MPYNYKPTLRNAVRNDLNRQISNFTTMYKKTWNNRNNSKVEFILDEPMLHESYKTFIKKVEDAVRELGEDSYSDIKITVDVL